MATPSYIRSPFSLAKRCKISPAVPTQVRTNYQSRQPWHAEDSPTLQHYKDSKPGFEDYMRDLAKDARGVTLPLREPKLPASIQSEVDALRPPRSVQLTYLRPLKRQPIHGIPACDLQLRSFSVRNLEFFADFALRAAYYLNLPARGPVPLPRITQRWTVPKANFIFKKSQENFERITMRRLIQIQDAHPEAVQIWLGFLQKYAYFGVGMKANVWEYSGVQVGEEMDRATEDVQERVRERLKLFGRRRDLAGDKEVERMVHDDVFKGVHGAMMPMGKSQYRAPAMT